MAPSGPPAKAAPKAEVKAKPKKAPKKEKTEEDEGPKMQAPDFDAHQELVGKVQEKIDKLQKSSAALTAKINEKSHGKEDFFAKKAAIRADLDAVSKEMDGFQEQKTQIRTMLGDKKAENAEMKQELGKMKKSMSYTNEADIDARIRWIEDKLHHDTNTLKAEKDYMLEIKELKKNKPKLAQLGGLQDKLSTFDAGTDLRGKQGEINEALAVLRERKKGIQEKFTELQEERKLQMGDSSELITEREENSKKIQELIQERSKLRDEFNVQKREFSVHLAEQRRIKQEKYQEDRKVQQEEWRVRSLEKKVEALDEQPYVSEITLIEQTIAFCNRILPKDEAKKEEEKKDTVFNNKDGEEVMASKKDRDSEMYFVPLKGKKAKKAAAAPAEGSKKPIKHNAETFKLFDSLKLDAPITTADIPALLTKLDEQMAMYEAKVKEWSENKEEMKRKIKEGIITAEDLDDKKEEDKADEKEEEKEEEKEA